MGKKKFTGDGIYFTGKASDDVTGSQYLVKFGKYNCLLECGLHQCSSNDYLDSYKINSAKFQFKPSEIDFLFVAHPHIDHCGLIPRLVHKGFRGKIIATRNTALVMKPLLLNSCFIIQNEARILSKKYKRDYQPLYDEDDVHTTLGLIQIYDNYNKIYQLADGISFQWLKNSHCIGSAQLQLILTNGIKTRKILYTSDIGALNSKNHYLKNTEIPKMFNDIAIMESTYGDSKRTSRKSRKYDNEQLKSAIDMTLCSKKGSVIMPCFSFSRTQEILTTLFDIYGKRKDFKFPVIVDSKLSCEISTLYSDLLTGDNRELWESVYNWKNVQFVTDKDASNYWVNNTMPKIIISSSGFCTNGRIVKYLKKYISDRNSLIIFSGYVGDNPSYLSYRIKNFRTNKFITINKERIINLAECITLSTFSSHANYNDLVKYGSSLNTNKLILVHGSPESKRCLSAGLQRAISKNDKTYRVISACLGMTIRL